MGNVWLCLDIFASTLGVVFGFSGCIIFFLYHNIVAGTWAFFSGLFAAICLQLHYLKYKNRLEQYHSSLALMKLADLGIVVACISFSFFVWYMFSEFYWHIPMMPIKDSYVIMAVWSFMTAKWGVLLYFISSKYGRLVSNEYAALITA